MAVSYGDKLCGNHKAICGKAIKAKAINSIMATFQLATAGQQACSLAYMAMIVVAFAVIGAGIAGAIRAYREDDISLFIKPFFLALAIAAVIVGSSNIFI